VGPWLSWSAEKARNRARCVRAEQQGRSAFAEELKKHNCGGQLGGRYLVKQVARLARRISPGASPCGGDAASRLSPHAQSPDPGRRTRHLDLHVLEPGLDVQVQSSERWANQRSRSAGKASNTSLNRRKAPFPSMATSSRSRRAGLELS